jgi:hypothetical protein
MTKKRSPFFVDQGDRFDNDWIPNELRSLPKPWRESMLNWQMMILSVNECRLIKAMADLTQSLVH